MIIGSKEHFVEVNNNVDTMFIGHKDDHALFTAIHNVFKVYDTINVNCEPWTVLDIILDANGEYDTVLIAAKPYMFRRAFRFWLDDLIEDMEQLTSPDDSSELFTCGYSTGTRDCLMVVCRALNEVEYYGRVS